MLSFEVQRETEMPVQFTSLARRDANIKCQLDTEESI